MAALPDTRESEVGLVKSGRRDFMRGWIAAGAEATDEIKQRALQAYYAMVFWMHADKGRFGRYIEEIENAYLRGSV